METLTKFQVKIYVMGQDPIVYEQNDNSPITVAQVLSKKGIKVADQTSVRINGKPGNLNELLQNNDQVVISQNIRGGVVTGIEISRE
ncbi:MAG: hypothetical protein HYW78_04390 [Parcubacteria group bacterium]|nr:hypothetical protein [Parcubacteria group bacterium]